ncbi:hypothetical protein E2C01_012938 [Portunus trituberculatus]|uniref:Uncharacterized protein n=1 Tax=Portunus trituberculatus TaxID=210409 RepID=A0A5B7DFC1_PORTR|nr:hypothetical protein [Portunus trituberculatus]
MASAEGEHGTHLSILWSSTPTTSPFHSKVIKIQRPMSDCALREFEQWVTHHPWTDVLEVKDVHTKWHNFFYHHNGTLPSLLPSKE